LGLCRSSDRDDTSDVDIKGLDQVLNHFGQTGWELVSVQPYEWNTPSDSYDYRGRAVEWHTLGQSPHEQHQYRTLEWTVSRYFCFFKRRL
jgi:hypothetical protein